MFNDIGLFIKIAFFALFILFIIVKALYESFWKPLAGQGGGLAAPPLPQKDAEALRRFLNEMRGNAQPPRAAPVEAALPLEPEPPQPSLGEALPHERKRTKRMQKAALTGGPPPFLPQAAAHAPTVHEYLEEMAHRVSPDAITLAPRLSVRLLSTHMSLRDAILVGVIFGKPKALERRAPPRCKSARLR